VFFCIFFADRAKPSGFQVTANYSELRINRKNQQVVSKNPSGSYEKMKCT